MENAINWNSSDDDVSMVSDVKGNAETIAERHQKAPAEESRSNKKNCDTKQKLLEQVGLYILYNNVLILTHIGHDLFKISCNKILIIKLCNENIVNMLIIYIYIHFVF